MALSIKYLGHSGFLLTDGAFRVVIDPFLTGNPLAACAPGDVACDTILLTHGHGDHVGDTVAIARSNNATVVSTFEVAAWVTKQEVGNCVGLNVGGTHKADWGTAWQVPAIHSCTLPDGSAGGCATGYVITMGGKTVYHLGDTALFSDLALAKRRGRIDVALIPCGGHFTMDIADAVEAVRLIEPTFTIPMHYNTFPPIEVDIGSFAPPNTKTVVLKPGATFEVPA